MVRRRPGDDYKPQCLTPTSTFGEGDLGCFSKAGMRIFVCEGCMIQATYQAIREETLFLSAMTMFSNSED